VWAGFKENINDYLPGLDIFVFPSRNEGLGSVLLDVMNAGVPIIASKVGGIPDIIKPGKTGFLVSVDNHIEIEHWILELKENSSLSDDIVKRARSFLNLYSKEMMAKKYMDIYIKTIGT
jgi:glycosyltransferase involved in cell wall biosynthesis